MSQFALVRAITVIPLLFCLIPVGQAQEEFASPHNVGGELWLVGNVRDRASQPLAGLTIELWQGDEQGNYRHPDMGNPDELRGDFQYFGTATTDEAGNFTFRTMTPGASLAGPARLHLKFHRAGETLLNAQLHFPEDHETLLGPYVSGVSDWELDTEALFLRDIAIACREGEERGDWRILFADIVLDEGAGELLPTPQQPPMWDSFPDLYPAADIRSYDNDLLDTDPHQVPLTINDAPEIPSGRVGDGLWLISRLFNRAGEPLAGYLVEIWHGDHTGAHDHPNDYREINRDTFQYYGAARTDERGFLVFRTLQPFPSGERAKHVHFMVKQDDEKLLISQFFFPEDYAYVMMDRYYLSRGHGDDELIWMRAATDDCITRAESDRFRAMFGKIVVDLGEGESFSTPRMGEGFYYPVVDFSDTDNDLLNPYLYQEQLTLEDAMEDVEEINPDKIQG